MKPDCNGMNGEHEEMEAVKTVCEKEDFGCRERVGRYWMEDMTMGKGSERGGEDDGAGPRPEGHDSA